MARASHYHVFALPPELLEALTPRNLISQTPPPAGDVSHPETPDPTPSQTTSGARACNVCLGLTFKDVEEQRTHFRSDWHRYNVKVRLNGGKPVSASDFARLIEDLEDSLSGSASSSEDDGSEDSDAVRNLLQRTKIASRPSSPTSGPSIPQTPLVWFHAPPATQIGVYKSIFPSDSTTSTYLDDLKRMQTGGGEEGRKWAMFMVAGGHFAGAIMRVSKPELEDEEEPEESGKKRKQKKPKTDTEVLMHKTFHRYTTRRKQGGSQSLNDQAKGNAKSAGAQLRRYGEQALRDDIRGLLTAWADELNQCERIWIRASTHNRRIFYDYDEAVIAKGDDRLRSFPFMTRRPTQSEVARCLLELTRVKVSHFTEEMLRAQDEAYLASIKPAPPKPKPPTTAPPPSSKEPKEHKLSKEEELFRDKWARLLDMIARGRLEALRSFWEREAANMGGVDARIPEWTGEARYATLLQFAVQAGQEEVTRWLLEDMHADPTVDVPASGVVSASVEDAETSTTTGRRTAYDVARTKELRDVFRRTAGTHPDWWDWFGAARVPSVLSKEMEEAKDEKKKIRRKGLKDKVKEREAKEKEREALSPAAEEVVEVKLTKKQAENLTGPRKLGGNAGAADGLEGLTPEMRAKVERERRARAVEERLKKLANK